MESFSISMPSVFLIALCKTRHFLTKRKGCFLTFSNLLKIQFLVLVFQKRQATPHNAILSSVDSVLFVANIQVYFLKCLQFLWQKRVCLDCPMLRWRRRFWSFCPKSKENLVRVDGVFKKFLCRCVRGYQKFISPLTPPSCRYYPTCSSYSLILFELTPSFYALFFSIIRIFKCNQFFKGGFDYPCIGITLSNILYHPIKISYWLIPTKSVKIPLFVCKPIKIRAYVIKENL